MLSVSFCYSSFLARSSKAQATLSYSLFQYELQGDYYIPCLKLPDEEEREIGVWGMRHLIYLKQHRKATYNRLQAEFKLNSYLYDINSQAEEMFETLIK